VKQEVSIKNTESNISSGDMDRELKAVPELAQAKTKVSSSDIKTKNIDNSTNQVKSESNDKHSSTVTDNAEVDQRQTNDNSNQVIEEDNVESPSSKRENQVDDKVANVSSEKIENQLEEKTENSSSELDHSKWNEILQASVSNSGNVDYGKIKSNSTKLDNYLKTLSDNIPQDSWSKNKTKAYWINAYNAFTIKLIIDNYPLGSITDLYGGKPWDHQWVKLGSKTYSLNDIEHKILRPTYNDARIHFAVNCAAKSCPKIWNKAWTESNIEGALDKLTREFVNNKQANQLSSKSVSVSKIFDWYKEDFGDLTEFLSKYSDTDISSDAKITYNDYNWKLNT